MSHDASHAKDVAKAELGRCYLLLTAYCLLGLGLELGLGASPLTPLLPY